LEKTLLPESSVPWLGRPSNKAEEVEEPSVVDDRVKVDDATDAAYDDVDEAEIYSPEGFGTGVGRV
jgi:hypothetical protein